MALLSIKNLTVEFKTSRGFFRAVDRVSFEVNTGEVLSIVGESGSGKSVAMLAVMGLLPWTAQVTADAMDFEGRNLLRLSPNERRALNGKDMAMIFQEPMTSLNPCFTVGWQLTEALRTHEKLDRSEAKSRAIALMDEVGIPAASQRMSAFPHQFSGGMAQRVMIAMALSCRPKLLIADEPTTALDVTIQAQILDLLVRLQKEKGMGLVLITHSMGVVAEMADRVCVQYAGQKVEEQPVKALFAQPRHPYTAALLSSLPERSDGRKLNSIKGVVPGQFDRPSGCLFEPRCAYSTDLCRSTEPVLQHSALCHYPLEVK
jgi:dipeptide transport system ATP-binding protein